MITWSKEERYYRELRYLVERTTLTGGPLYKGLPDNPLDWGYELREAVNRGHAVFNRGNKGTMRRGFYATQAGRDFIYEESHKYR